MRYRVTDQQFLGLGRGDHLEAEPDAPRIVAALKAGRLVEDPEQQAAVVAQDVAEPAAEPIVAEPPAKPRPRRAKRGA